MTKNKTPDNTFRVLVIGCTRGSFGGYVAQAFDTVFEDRYMYPNWSVVRAGLPDDVASGYEYDVTDPQNRHNEAMLSIRPHHVVYAAGMNLPDGPNGIWENLTDSAAGHFEVNVEGFLRVAQAFKAVAYPGSQLVAVSSNSARIPRSPSLGYCVSKAALSMAVQVLARRWKGEPIVWGVEPGLMNTQATIEMVNQGGWVSGGQTAMHRMVGVSSQYGLPASQLAESVAHDVLWGGHWLNGTLRQMDAGEL